MRPGQCSDHPWGQYGILEARRLATELDAKARSTNIRDLEFQSEDEGSEYSYSESSSISGDDVATSHDGGHEHIGTDLNVDENELNDLKKDAAVWPEPPSEEEVKAEEERLLDEQIVQLENVEAEAKAAYDPNEVAALMAQLLDLLVLMGHFKEGSVSRAPHHPPIDLSLARELGYDERALELLQKLPYVSNSMYDRRIIPGSQFMNYLSKEALEDGRVYIGYDAYGAEMDPWMVMLVRSFDPYGWLVFLDVKLGVIRAFNKQHGPHKTTVEWKRYDRKSVPEVIILLEYHKAPCVPAAVYLRNFIDSYRSLDRIPLMNPDGSDTMINPAEYGRLDKRMCEDYRKEWGPQQNQLLKMYEKHGWPDSWDRGAFIVEWNALHARVRPEKSIGEIPRKGTRKEKGNF